MPSLTIPAGGLGIPLELGSSATTVTNNGPGTLYYRDESPVTSSVNDGSIAPGGSASLADTQYVLASGGAASIQYVVLAVSSGGGGGASTSAAGVIGKGYCIPYGALDKWKADRDAAASKLVEVIGFGDSLTDGQTTTGNFYSFLQRLRERSTGAGFTDGGRGLNAQSDTATDVFTGEVAPVSAKTGFAAATPAGLSAMPGALFSTAASDTVTLKVVGPRARLWFSRYTLGSRFTYQINAGATVTVNSGSSELAPLPSSSGGVSSIDFVNLTTSDGLTSGTNTIVVTNLGGTPTVAPTISSVGSSTGTLTGTYYYTATTVNSGETTSGNVLSRTVAAGGNNVVFSKGQGGKTVNVYRGTALAGPFQFIGTTTGNNNSAYSFLDDGSATPGANPPVTNTAALDTGSPNAAIVVEALKNTGIVWQNHGVQGQETDGMFSTQDPLNNPVALASLGLQWGTGTNGITVGTASEVLGHASASGQDSPVVRATARKPTLTIIAYGTNDIQKAEGGANALAAPSAATGGTGIGSGLAAATYFYKLQRVTSGQFGGGPLSPASSGTVTTAGQQVIVSPPQLGAGNYVGVPVFNVYRSTTSGGTYGFVGQIVGASGQFIDNVATPGAAPSQTTAYSPIVDTSSTENALALGIRMARNAGSDVLIVLPSIESLNNSRSLGGVFKAAIQRVAESFSCAWVDWDVALGPVPLRSGLGYGGGNSNPHLLKPAYQAQGDFLWDNVLSK